MSAGMTEAAERNTLLFYKQIEPLSSEQHAKLGIREIENPYSFLAGTHLVPLTVDEFVAASVSYPIIFDTQSKIPLAVMGMREGQNVFFGFDGRLDPEIYVPAFARRYPFITANAPPTNGEARSVVCIDRAAPMLSEAPETPFFQNGEPTQFTQNAIEFCRQFEALLLRTQEFVALCEQNNLFELTPINIQANQNGEPQTQRIGEYLRVSDQKLKGVPQDVYLNLRDRGVDIVVYAHLISQQNWAKVLARTAKMQSSVPLG